MNSALNEACIKYELFISYHSEVAKKVKKFADLIQEKTTWRTFLASSDTNDTEQKMYDALYHSRIFVFFQSRAYSDSYADFHEKWARQLTKAIIEIPEQLSLKEIETKYLDELDEMLKTSYNYESDEFRMEMFNRKNKIGAFKKGIFERFGDLERVFTLELDEKRNSDECDDECRQFIDGLYRGKLNERGLKHGMGTMEYKNKEFYCGHWANDFRNGYGRMEETFGDYEGQYLNGKKHGVGFFRNKADQIYMGEWRDGKYHGNGVLTKGNKDAYCGEWKDGERHGKGIEWLFSIAELYEGEWKNDKKNGRGVYLNSNREKHEGDWVDNVKHGEGVLYYPNGDKFEGNWLKGKIDGKGKLYCASGEIFECDYKNGKEIISKRVKIHMNTDEKAKGEYKFENGGLFEGDLINGKPNGKGKCEFSDGYRYEGDWKNGEMSGNGILFFKDGSKASGVFRNNHLDSIQTYEKPNGKQATKYFMNLQIYFDWKKEKPLIIKLRERLINNADLSDFDSIMKRFLN